MTESTTSRTSKKKDKRKEEGKRKKSIANCQLMTQRTPIKPPSCLVRTKPTTEEKMRSSHQSKFIILQEENPASNSVEIAKEMISILL